MKNFNKQKSLSFELGKWGVFSKKLRVSEFSGYFVKLKEYIKFYANLWWYRARRFTDVFVLGAIDKMVLVSEKFRLSKFFIENLFKKRYLGYIRWFFLFSKVIKTKGLAGWFKGHLFSFLDKVNNKNLLFVIFTRLMRLIGCGIRVKWVKFRLLREWASNFSFLADSKLNLKSNLKKVFWEERIKFISFVRREILFLLKIKINPSFKIKGRELFRWLVDGDLLQAIKITTIREVTRSMVYDEGISNEFFEYLSPRVGFDFGHMWKRVYGYNWQLVRNFFWDKAYKGLKFCYFVFKRSSTNYFLSVMSPRGKLLGKMSGGTSVNLKSRKEKLNFDRNTKSMYKFIEVYVLDPLQYKLIYIIMKFSEHRFVFGLSRYVRQQGREVIGVSLVRRLPHGYGLRRAKLKRR